MKPLLGRGRGQSNDDLLAQFACCRVLLAFDFDGTLAPIVRDRELAVLRASTLRLFERLCELYPCAVVSGRSQRDLTRRLEPAAVEYVVGSQRLEVGRRAAAFARQVAEALPILEAALAGYAGLKIDIEDKQYSIAVHYRRSRGKREAQNAIAQAVARLPARMRLIPGKLVVNIVPAAAPNKGDAVLALRAQLGADTALYVGDDVSDEDVFCLDQPGRLLGVRVGRSLRSAAPYYLRDQAEIDELLRRLISVRAGIAQRERLRRLGG